MGYICYLYTRGSKVPHMEVIHSPTLEEAQALAGRMFGNHAEALRAELFQGDERVATVMADNAHTAV